MPSGPLDIAVSAHTSMCSRAGARRRLRLLRAAPEAVAKREGKAFHGARRRRGVRRRDGGNIDRRAVLGAKPLRLVCARSGHGDCHRVKRHPAGQHVRAAGCSERERERCPDDAFPHVPRRPEGPARQCDQPAERPPGMALLPAPSACQYREASEPAIASSSSLASCVRPVVSQCSVRPSMIQRSAGGCRGYSLVELQSGGSSMLAESWLASRKPSKHARSS